VLLILEFETSYVSGSDNKSLLFLVCDLHLYYYYWYTGWMQKNEKFIGKVKQTVADGA